MRAGNSAGCGWRNLSVERQPLERPDTASSGNRDSHAGIEGGLLGSKRIRGQFEACHVRMPLPHRFEQRAEPRILLPIFGQQRGVRASRQLSSQASSRFLSTHSLR